MHCFTSLFGTKHEERGLPHGNPIPIRTVWCRNAKHWFQSPIQWNSNCPSWKDSIAHSINQDNWVTFSNTLENICLRTRSNKAPTAEIIGHSFFRCNILVKFNNCLVLIDARNVELLILLTWDKSLWGNAHRLVYIIFMFVILYSYMYNCTGIFILYIIDDVQLDACTYSLLDIYKNSLWIVINLEKYKCEL